MDTSLESYGVNSDFCMDEVTDSVHPGLMLSSIAGLVFVLLHWCVALCCHFLHIDGCDQDVDATVGGIGSCSECCMT